MRDKDMNPLADDKSITSKIKKFKFGMQKDNENTNTTDNNIYSAIASFVGCNDAIPICAEACSCCWDKKVPDSYSDKMTYIGKRSKTGHTSILEHSNYIILISIGDGFKDSLIEFIDCVDYLHTKIIFGNNGYIYLLIGGSFRGYSDLFMRIKDQSNPILKSIRSNIYTYAPSCAFEDLISKGILDYNKFESPVLSDEYIITDDIINNSSNNIETDLFKIVGIDSMEKLYKNIINIEPYLKDKFTAVELLPFVTATVLFKNMSRTCTHQLVRHRNAITQESQRYVDYSNANFSSPDMFKPDKYDKDHKYTITFGTGPNQKMTLTELGEALCNIYNLLRDTNHSGKGYELLKEDARAFLPSNVQCGKIYITFNIKNLLMFLILREDPAAQSEIRKYANAVGDWIRNNTNYYDYKDYIRTPAFMIDGEIYHIDEEGNIETQIIPTENDYIKAAGLYIEEISE